MSWHPSPLDKGKKIDERFENLPPLETIHPDELKNYTRAQLSWYLEQRGMIGKKKKKTISYSIFYSWVIYHIFLIM